MASSPTALDYVTLGIAAVGAITGLGALGATWAQFMLSGPRVKVTAGTAMPTVTQVFVYYVSVENIGRMPVMVHGLGLELPNDAQVPLGVELARGRGRGPDLPRRIEPSDTESWYFDIETTLETLRGERFPTSVRAFAQSGSKRTYTKRKIDLDKMAELNRPKG